MVELLIIRMWLSAIVGIVSIVYGVTLYVTGNQMISIFPIGIGAVMIYAFYILYTNIGV